MECIQIHIRGHTYAFLLSPRAVLCLVQEVEHQFLTHVTQGISHVSVIEAIVVVIPSAYDPAYEYITSMCLNL
jgi:hypothetical protein